LSTWLDCASSEHSTRPSETVRTGRIRYILMPHGELMPVGKQALSQHGVAH
jgi:hypothetical protein